jgi:hypothetical protein
MDRLPIWRNGEKAASSLTLTERDGVRTTGETTLA